MNYITVALCILLAIEGEVRSDGAYSYIVVGSGSGGAVVANRLSEDPNVKVLLLESGGPPMARTEKPVTASVEQFTRQNWNYLMEKQDNFGLGLVDGIMGYPRGRVLGGTTVINYMIHIRGNKADYNRWANLGNPGWSYDEVLPYFRKSEDSTVKISDEKYRGHGGLLSVSDVPYRTESVHAFVKACQEAGYPYVDYNGRNQLGVSYVQGALRGGRRCSAEKAFIRPARARPNLRIRLNSHVTKVLIEPGTKRAFGVEYLHSNQRYVVNATIEVILSAGAFHSPQILMLSGIGPRDHLLELGIPLVQDLPVGKNLYDHLTFLGLMFTVNKPIVAPFWDTFSIRSLLEFLLFGRGPMTSLGGVEALAYFKTNVTSYPEDYPDMELIFIGGGLHTDSGTIYRRMFRVSDAWYYPLWQPLEAKYAYSILPMHLHPKSHGHMKLRSTKPLDPPRFYGNYLTDPNNEDVKEFIAAVRESQRIMRSPALQRYGAEQVKTVVPGCEMPQYDSDAYWECALRHLTTTLHHQIMTCKMGPSSDPEAVVDPRLRVYGVKRLRVIDTSVIPTTISAHVSAVGYVVGEKGSDLIKEDYQRLLRENMDGTM
ncbi:glucose dehydrogenase [FAD, quinone]-like isoform X2 [Photinus pyralis]|uniref:glucose dehydrogenase [FAD, quinone]-like isoform X2 n=1 Tax=Photinus pyralis TaxID=7054 RepID=UPI001267657F|nr:glucose dehydrogenase [FAD, quinone]-like isoform X2 [Photinus pyralis]